LKHIKGFINSDVLWTGNQFGLEQFEIPLIDLQTFKPKPIPTNLRLGHQIEHIFTQLLRYCNEYKVLAHSIQIKNGNNTIGELDYLIQSTNENQRLIHLELSYKFYLLDPDISEPIHRLVGPNRKDMFFTKLDKTKDKQLPLLFTDHSRRTLISKGLPTENIEQQVCFKAQLFAPYEQKLPSIRPLNTSCVTGYWLRFSDFENADFKTNRFYLPRKYEWLHAPHTGVKFSRYFDTLMEINLQHLNERAPMVWMKKPDGIIEKFFVVWW